MFLFMIIVVSGRVPTNRSSQRGEPQYTCDLINLGNAIVVGKRAELDALTRFNEWLILTYT